MFTAHVLFICPLASVSLSELFSSLVMPCQHFCATRSLQRGRKYKAALQPEVVTLSEVVGAYALLTTLRYFVISHQCIHIYSLKVPGADLAGRSKFSVLVPVLPELPWWGSVK